MLRKFAVALLAASVFTAPVLAQGTQTASPPAKTGAVAAAPKAIAAKPALKAAKVKHATRHVARVTRRAQQVDDGCARRRDELGQAAVGHELKTASTSLEAGRRAGLLRWGATPRLRAWRARP